jgi:hypothetical protein
MAERVAPAIDWVRATIVALLIIVAGVTAWELKMRAEGLSTRDLGDGDSHWAREWRRVENGEGQAVIVGSSRLLFNIDPQLWGHMTGVTPIQLAREGTSPRSVIAALAADPKFKGLVIVGYDPIPFHRDRGLFNNMVETAREEPLFKRSGLLVYDQLARWFAFLDSRMTPMSWIERIDVPQRTARGAFNQPWKLVEIGEGRAAAIWPRVETDARYQAKAEAIWMLPPPPGAKPLTPAQIRKLLDKLAQDVARIRARGGEVVFVNSPSDSPLLDREKRLYPRTVSWDYMIRRTGAVGIHWTDDPVLSRLRTVELSHLSRADRPVFTRRVVQLIDAELAKRGRSIGGFGVRPPSSGAGAPAAPQSERR